MKKADMIFLIPVILIAMMILAAIIVIAPGITGHDDPPPQVRAGWYLPGHTLVLHSNGIPNITMEDRLVLTGWYEGTTPGLPALSRFSRYENYSLERTGGRYQIAAWYCEDDTACSETGPGLLDYLKTRGTASAIILDIPVTQVHGEDVKEWPIPAIKFQSTTTSGYFIAIDRPLNSPFGDRIIQYYGTESQSVDIEQDMVLRGMIAVTFSGREMPAFAEP